jgi:hypothetical protein
VLAYDGAGFPAAYGWRRDGELWVEVPEVATFHLPAGGTVVGVIAGDAVDSAIVLDAYYGTALPFVLQATHGLEVLHASAVLSPANSGVVAFCGGSESGKSTVAYGLAARGYSHWADDAVAFRADARPLSAVGLPFTIKLRESSLAYFRGADAGPSEEAVEDFEWTSTRLAAVFLLEPHALAPSGAPAVEVERLSPGEALHALLPNAYRFQPQAIDRRRETMRSYLELVASIPILCARFSHRLDRLTALLDELDRRMEEVA